MQFELVKLNLQNPDVKNYLFDVCSRLGGDYGIDGLRLDVAYCLDLGFYPALRGFWQTAQAGVCAGGRDAARRLQPLDERPRLPQRNELRVLQGSVFLELQHRQPARDQLQPEPPVRLRRSGALYTGKHLLRFVDNHDVTRIATILTDKSCLRPIYGLLFGMPGVPSVYYGSEWGMEGDKRNGDPTLRPAVEKPEKTT